MKLKEKTHRKFVEFFAERCCANPEQELELAFAEIQRSTGTASVTLKRALYTLVEEGLISMVPGRNSRYARFKVLNPAEISVKERDNTDNGDNQGRDINSFEQEIDLLKRRIRSQEIAISLLQDRLADFEDKVKMIHT